MQKLTIHKLFENMSLKARRTNRIAGYLLICYSFWTMKHKLWIMIATYIAYCIDKELYKAIEYLKTQVEVLLEQQEKQNKRILLTDHQRIRIATKAKRLSRKVIEQCTVLFTPHTVIRWYNKLIAEKYDVSSRRGKVGRPQITAQIVNLVIKFKEENPRWGYQKMTDQIEYLGFKISKNIC